MSVESEAARHALNRWFPVLAVAMVLLFGVRNFPWHLDNYDQAKQAYTSFEMITEGHWWFQHTPNQLIATKPPLAGWISVAGYYLTGGAWEFAWRLPSFISALVLLALLKRTGDRMFESPIAGTLAATAFGLNLVAPRLATLVRTDMLLALFIFLAGLLMTRKVQANERWSPAERCWLSGWVLCGTMTKGPIIYAFLLPGLLAYWFWCRRRKLPCFAWPGWWPWVAPLLCFGLWAVIGMWKDRDFYEQVVLREFLGRFTVGEEAVHNNQPLYFYVLQLLRMFLPWSVLLLALAASKRTRELLARRPLLIWLLCWVGGALLFMSLVPSKRADRIFPILPPLCLFLGGAVMYLPPLLWNGWRRERVLLAVAVIALMVSGGYTVHNVIKGVRNNAGALVAFGREVREKAAAAGLNYGAVRGPHEGMLLYLRQARFLKEREAMELWSAATLNGLVIREGGGRRLERELAGGEILLRSPPANDGTRYLFIGRAKSEP